MQLIKTFFLTLLLVIAVRLPHGDSAAQLCAQDATETLRQAIRFGDAEQVGAILEDNPELVEHQGEYGFTPLMLAAFWADTETVKAVIDAGADVDAVNAWGGQAINYVAGDLGKLKILEAAGADIHHATELGFTSLIAAVRDAFALDAVKYLVQRGANVNHTTKQGIGPIAIAAETGNLNLVRYLISNGAEPEDVKMQTFTAANGEKIGRVMPFHASAMQNALNCGYVDIAQELKDAGAAPGSTIFTTIFHHQPEAIRFSLEELGEKPSMPLLLHVAAYSDYGEAETIQVLLDAGMKADQVLPLPLSSHLGVPESAADIAARSGDTPAKKLLVEAGSPLTDDWVQWKKKTPPARQIDPQTIRAEDLIASIQGAQPLLERTIIDGVKMNQLYSRDNKKCISCHNQTMPFIALANAKNKDIPFDQKTYDQMVAVIVDNYSHGELRKLVEVDVDLSPGQSSPLAVWALVDAGLEPDMRFDGELHTTAIYQSANGGWKSLERRSPIMDSDITPTAWSIRALARYPMKGRRVEFQRRIQRARVFLQKQTPRSAEESASQLLGLYWSGLERAALKPYIAGLLARQREDGGWTSAPYLKESDAYGTGQALYALREAGGLGLADQAYRLGLAFLLKTQMADGSWFVRRRAVEHLETQDPVFPHGRDAWISSMATSYAVLALSATLDAQHVAEILAAGHYQRFERIDEILPELPPAHDEPVDFVSDIEPLLDNSCLGCHSSGSSTSGGYFMETRARLIRGNRLGPDVIVPGNSAKSKFVDHITDRIEDVEMPPLPHRGDYDKLSPNEIGKIRRWIDDGLPGFDE